MKKTLTIILLSISLSGFSQTMKGDWVLTPTVGWNSIYPVSNETTKGFFINLPISVQYYLSDKFAIGLTPSFYYSKYEYNPIDINEFYRKTIQAGIQLRPVVRYNILKARFTPFIESGFSNLFDFGYFSQYHDNPNVNVSLREISNTYFESFFSISHINVNIGVSYFIKDRFALQTKFAGFDNSSDGISVYANLPINFGLQFIINNPRSEIESPR